MPLYSYSRLHTYEKCPQHYKHRYIDQMLLAEGCVFFPKKNINKEIL